MRPRRRGADQRGADGRVGAAGPVFMYRMRETCRRRRCDPADRVTAWRWSTRRRDDVCAPAGAAVDIRVQGGDCERRGMKKSSARLPARRKKKKSRARPPGSCAIPRAPPPKKQPRTRSKTHTRLQKVRPKRGYAGPAKLVLVALAPHHTTTPLPEGTAARQTRRPIPHPAAVHRATPRPPRGQPGWPPRPARYTKSSSTPRRSRPLQTGSIRSRLGGSRSS